MRGEIPCFHVAIDIAPTMGTICGIEEGYYIVCNFCRKRIKKPLTHKELRQEIKAMNQLIIDGLEYIRD